MTRKTIDKDRMKRLFARTDMTSIAIASVLGCSRQFVSEMRSAWLKEESAQGRTYTCECGRPLMHPNRCRFIVPTDVAMIRGRLLTGEPIDAIAKSTGYTKATLVCFALRDLTGEEKAVRQSTSRSLARIAAIRSMKEAAKRSALRASPEWKAEKDRLLLDWSVSIAEVAERTGLTPQRVGQLRKRESERLKGEGAASSYHGGPNSGRTLGPRQKVDRKAIVTMLKGDLTAHQIADRLKVPFNHVQRVLSSLPAAFSKDRNSRMTAAANRRGAMTRYGAKEVADPVHSAVRAAVPKSLPTELAEDVVQELVVKVLAGEATIVDMAAARRAAMTEQRRVLGMSLSGPISLDEKVFEDGTATRMDMLVDASCEDEDSILDRIDREREQEHAWRMVA